MSANCQAAVAEIGNGVAAALRAVDCTANEITAQAFGRLFAPGGALGPALTILLTIFIALFAVSLLLGRSNISVRALMPKIITLGLVLTFATSWVAYQGVVWNLAISAPDWLASVLTGSEGSATATFAHKIDIVFLAVQEATRTQTDIGAFSPEGMLWFGAMLLLLGTVGLLVTARIGLAVLVALGPIFVVMALFNGTRGMFTGWLKGVVMLALTPLFAVLGGSIMLELAVPVLARLTVSPAQVDAQAAMAFFMIGAVQVALMMMTIKIAGTMVAGWRVFGLVPEKGLGGVDAKVGFGRSSLEQALVTTQQQQAPSQESRRNIPVSAAAVTTAANDTGPVQASGTRRETRVLATSPVTGRMQPLAPSASRTRGIGNRFRAPNTRTEKMK